VIAGRHPVPDTEFEVEQTTTGWRVWLCGEEVPALSELLRVISEAYIAASPWQRFRFKLWCRRQEFLAWRRRIARRWGLA
jgi:hypothetical protein